MSRHHPPAPTRVRRLLQLERQRAAAQTIGRAIADESRQRRERQQLPARLRTELDVATTPPVARPLPSVREQLIAAGILTPGPAAEDPDA
jgi:hypothetical protein